MQAVVAAYKDTADPKKVWGTGLHIAGEKYVTLKADDRSLYGKKVSNKLPRLLSLLRASSSYTEALRPRYKLIMGGTFRARKVS
jgi:hypothetical protein